MLVVVHEFGHFVVARRNGVEAEEFSIFFPPRIFKRKTKKGWQFSIGLLPLGGYVKLKGENDSDTRPHSYGAASLWSKTKIMLAGVVMNLLAAFVLLTILAVVGMPKLIPNQFTIASDTSVSQNEVLVGFVEKSSPAAHAGIKSGDKLQSITPLATHHKITVKNASKLPGVTKSLAGQEVRVRYSRSGSEHVAVTTLRSQKVVKASLKTSNPKGYIGIIPTQYTLRRSTWSAPVVAGGLIGQFTSLTFQGIGTAISSLVQGNTQKAGAQVAGPVGIFELFKQGSLIGYKFMLMIVAIISLSLAIMNILPIPALDGGKVFVTLISRGVGKKLSERAEAAIYGTGFMVLIALVILITISDVSKRL
jgi:regulator of sigma E protease